MLSATWRESLQIRRSTSAMNGRSRLPRAGSHSFRTLPRYSPTNWEYIQFDEPENVINIILEVYDQKREAVAAHPGRQVDQGSLIGIVGKRKYPGSGWPVIQQILRPVTSVGIATATSGSVA